MIMSWFDATGTAKFFRTYVEHRNLKIPTNLQELQQHKSGTVSEKIDASVISLLLQFKPKAVL